MNLVSLERVSRAFAAGTVLDDVTVGIADGDRVGLIGINGSGKSTLLKIVAGEAEPDSGRVVHRDALSIAFAAQQVDLDPGEALLSAVIGRVEGDDGERDARARGLLHHLGLTNFDRAVGQLSGGQRKRLALARALLDDPELLILDEPTNHLDVDVVEWLEGQLRSRRGALLLVTHDRYLLDKVATRIVELHDAKLHDHAGGYASYLETRVVREEQAASIEQHRQNRLRTEIAWLRRSPAARTSKSRYRVDQANALIAADPVAQRTALSIELPSRRLGGKVVNLHNAGKSYGDEVVLAGVEHLFGPGDRVGIVGPNGSGKSTLLGLISGRLEPDTGSVRTGSTVHLGFYGQDPRPLPPRQRVLEAVTEVVRETNLVSGLRVSASQLLERFQFDSDAQRAFVGELSGGERRRLELLLVLADAPNLLLLDEPTNDLDLDTLSALEEYLDDWPGTLVCASHDRYFLDRVVDQLFAIQPGGGVRHYPGGWTAYRQAQAKARKSASPGSTLAAPGLAAAGTASATTGVRRKLTYNEQRELRQLDDRMPALEARKVELAEQMAMVGDNFAAATRLGEELTAVMEELEVAETRWMQLAEIAEAS